MQALSRDGCARREIAILYRSNAQSRVLEHALFSARIPYRVYGGLRFFERQEVKHALAYLRLLANPDDDTSFLRVVNFPARGIGARSVEALQDAAQAHGASLWKAAAELGGKPGAAVGAFVKLIDDAARQHARAAAGRGGRARHRGERPRRALHRPSARAPTGSRTWGSW